MTDVEYTEQAVRQLEKLDPQVADRILNKVDEATERTDHRLEPLSGYPYYKLRAGDFRVIVSWNRGDDTLVVEAVGHRRNIYDRHLPPWFPLSPHWLHQPKFTAGLNNLPLPSQLLQ